MKLASSLCTFSRTRLRTLIRMFGDAKDADVAGGFGR